MSYRSDIDYEIGFMTLYCLFLLCICFLSRVICYLVAIARPSFAGVKDLKRKKEKKN